MFAMYIEYSSTLHNGIQNVYFGANNTEEGLSPTKSILCVYMYTKCILFVVFSGYEICWCIYCFFCVRYTFCILQVVPNY